MNKTYSITFYELSRNDFTTTTVMTSSFENALEYARSIQGKEQTLIAIKIQEEQ